MSTPVAGALAVTPAYVTPADALVLWDDPGQTWRSLGTISVGTVTSISAGTGITVSPSPIVGAGTVSLTVPVSVANGGTGTTTAMTAGSVVFAGASGAYSQDNANLFWDDANNRLGIGTASPANPFQVHVATNLNLSVRTGGSNIQLFSANDANNAYVQLGIEASSLLINQSGGNVGIGTASPGYALDVVGSARLRHSAAIGSGTAGRSLFFSDSTPTNIAEIQSWDFDGTSYGMKFRAYGSIGLPGDVMSIVGNGNVGIGTTLPAQRLDVIGSLALNGQTVLSNPAAPNTGFTVMVDNGGSFALQASNDRIVYSNTYHLFQNRAQSVVWVQFDTGGTRNVSGAWIVISAREMKQEITPYTRGLDAVRMLNPCVFRYRAGTPFARGEDEASDLMIGLMADEVEPHVPEIVGEMTATVGDRSDVAISTLAPGLLVFSLINSVKTLAEQNAALSLRIEALEGAAA